MAELIPKGLREGAAAQRMADLGDAIKDALDRLTDFDRTRSTPEELASGAAPAAPLTEGEDAARQKILKQLNRDIAEYDRAIARATVAAARQEKEAGREETDKQKQAADAQKTRDRLEREDKQVRDRQAAEVSRAFERSVREQEQAEKSKEKETASVSKAFEKSVQETEKAKDKETRAASAAFEKSVKTQESQKKKEEEENAKLWEKRRAAVSREASGLFHGLLPMLPRSAGGLVGQAASAGNTGLSSTLSKSWELVLLQVQRSLIPVVLELSSVFQRLARNIKDNGLLGGLAKTAARQPLAAGAIAGGGAYLVGAPILPVAAIGAGIAGLGRLAHDYTSGVPHPSLRAVRGGIFAQIFQPEQVKKFKQEAADTRAKGKKGNRLLTDINPPGYHAQFTAFSDVRKNLQTASLNTTEIDRELQKQRNEIQLETLAEVRALREGLHRGLPPNEGY